jgi:hypothetical protein
MYFLSCVGDKTSEGTIVGNPGKVGGVVADSEGVIYDNGSTYLNSITYVKKENDGYYDEFTDEIDDVLDLMDRDSFFEIKGGGWTSVELEFHNIYVEGTHITDNEDIDFVMILDETVIELQASDSITISEQMYILEMAQPNYFVNVSFEEFANEDGVVEIFEDNEETSDLFHIVDKEVQGQTTLFEDSDQDGQINDTERAFPVATADEEEVASGNVGVTQDDDSVDESSEEPLDDIPTQNDQDGIEENESYSYSTGCSDSRLTMALLPIIGFIRIRRQTKEI